MIDRPMTRLRLAVAMVLCAALLLLAPPATATAARLAQQTGYLTATVTSEGLNVRSGPGAGYPRVTVVRRADTLIVLGRDASCAWLQVETPDGLFGWVAAQNTRLDGDCRTAPVKQAAVLAESAPAAGSQQETGSPGLITDFERFGVWTRGDQAWGRFTQTDINPYNGRYSGEFTFDFPASSDNFVVFRQVLPMPGRPDYLSMWVNGDASGSFINAWVQDANGSIWQFTFGQVDFTGWRQLTAPLKVDAGWPNGLVSGNQAAGLVYPLKFYALVVDGAPDDKPIRGSIAVDDLYAGGQPTGQVAGQTTNQAVAATPVPPTPRPTPRGQAATPAPSGGGQIAFRSDATTLNAGQCATVRWDVENVKAVYLQQGQDKESGVVGHGSQQVCPKATTTYQLRVVLRDGSQQRRTLTVTVRGAGATNQQQPPPKSTPEYTISADQMTLAPGDCTILRWATANAAYVYLDIESEPVAARGQHPICPEETTTYTLFVVDAMGNEKIAAVTVVVEDQAQSPPVAPPEVRFWADKERLTAGECTVLRWETKNAIAVRFGVDDLRESVPLTGEWGLCPIKTLTYLLEVDGAQASVHDMLTVWVGSPSLAAPSGLWPEDGAVFPAGTKSVEFGWAPVDSADEYEYEWCNEERCRRSGYFWHTTTTGGVNFDETGGQIQWRVRARAHPVESDWSEWRTFTVEAE